MPSEHIIKSYDEGLEQLQRTIRAMGMLATEQLFYAVDATIRRDSELAAKVVQRDAELDRLERSVNDIVVRLLALLQPVAVDLRAIVSALKISADLERVGDYAANIGKRAIVLNQSPPIPAANSLLRMARFAEMQIREVLSALETRDMKKALRVWSHDEELDEMAGGLFRELVTYMMEDPRHITAATHLLFMAKNIERIGDHVSNIAESIYFLVEGVELSSQIPHFGQSSEAGNSSPVPFSPKER